MSSPPKFILTSSSSQPSRLGDSLLLSEEVRVYEVAIDEQKRTKQLRGCETSTGKQRAKDDQLLPLAANQAANSISDNAKY
jgi:hypothetical protein